MLPIVVDGEIPSWDMHPVRTEEQFDRVIEILETELGATVVEMTQGPGAKIAWLGVAEVLMTLRFSSLSGVTLESADHSGVSKMHEIRDHFTALLA